MSVQRHTAGVAALAACVAVAGVAGAGGPVELDVVGNCPSQKLVEEQVDPLVSSMDPRLAPARVSVRDEGARYTVQIGDARRAVDDPERRCLERARVAAVFIALNVPRPERSAPPAPPPPVPAPPPPPVPPSETWLSLHADFELGAASADLAAPGGGVGLALHHTSWRFALDASVLSNVELGGPEQGSASLLRAPMELTLAYLVSSGTIDVGPRAGLQVDVLHARGRDVPGADEGTRANVGAELGVLARWRALDRLGLLATLGVSAFAARYELSVEPTGALATTPRFWAASTIGIFWDFRDSEPHVP